MNELDDIDFTGMGNKWQIPFAKITIIISSVTLEMLLGALEFVTLLPFHPFAGVSESFYQLVSVKKVKGIPPADDASIADQA